MNQISILICTEFEVFQALEMYHAVVFSCFKITLCVGIWYFFFLSKKGIKRVRVSSICLKSFFQHVEQQKQLWRIVI